MSRYATASIVVSTALIGGFFATDTSANLYLDCNNPRTPQFLFAMQGRSKADGQTERVDLGTGNPLATCK